MNVHRGEVVLIDYPYAVGTGRKVRPAVVVQNDTDNSRLNTTIIAQITGNITRAGKESTQLLIDTNDPDGKQSGLLKSSVVNCANLFTIARADILRKLGELSPRLLKELERCLKASLHLS